MTDVVEVELGAGGADDDSAYLTIASAALTYVPLAGIGSKKK